MTESQRTNNPNLLMNQTHRLRKIFSMAVAALFLAQTAVPAPWGGAPGGAALCLSPYLTANRTTAERMVAVTELYPEFNRIARPLVGEVARSWNLELDDFSVSSIPGLSNQASIPESMIPSLMTAFAGSISGIAGALGSYQFLGQGNKAVKINADEEAYHEVTDTLQYCVDHMVRRGQSLVFIQTPDQIQPGDLLMRIVPVSAEGSSGGSDTFEKPILPTFVREEQEARPGHRLIKKEWRGQFHTLFFVSDPIEVTNGIVSGARGYKGGSNTAGGFFELSDAPGAGALKLPDKDKAYVMYCDQGFLSAGADIDITRDSVVDLVDKTVAAMNRNIQHFLASPEKQHRYPGVLRLLIDRGLVSLSPQPTLSPVEPKDLHLGMLMRDRMRGSVRELIVSGVNLGDPELSLLGALVKAVRAGRPAAELRAQCEELLAAPVPADPAGLAAFFQQKVNVFLDKLKKECKTTGQAVRGNVVFVQDGEANFSHPLASGYTDLMISCGGPVERQFAAITHNILQTKAVEVFEIDPAYATSHIAFVNKEETDRHPDSELREQVAVPLTEDQAVTLSAVTPTLLARHSRLTARDFITGMTNGVASSAAIVPLLGEAYDMDEQTIPGVTVDAETGRVKVTMLVTFYGITRMVTATFRIPERLTQRNAATQDQAVRQLVLLTRLRLFDRAHEWEMMESMNHHVGVMLDLFPRYRELFVNSPAADADKNNCEALRDACALRRMLGTPAARHLLGETRQAELIRRVDYDISGLSKYLRECLENYQGNAPEAAGFLAKIGRSGLLSAVPDAEAFMAELTGRVKPGNRDSVAVLVAA